MRIDFDWDPAKAASNLIKHGVSFDAAMTIFHDPLALSLLDTDVTEEERWISMGTTSAGNLIVVVHTWAEMDAGRTMVRVISARRPTRKEERQYREEPLR
jgi:hypothetical protein